VRLVEISFDANAYDWVVRAVAPSAAQGVQAGRAVLVAAAPLALLAGHAGRRGAGGLRKARAAEEAARPVQRPAHDGARHAVVRLVQPLAAQTELVLRRVHRKRETFLRKKIDELVQLRMLAKNLVYVRLSLGNTKLSFV